MLFMGVEHKETYFQCAFTMQDLLALKFVHDHATINFDSAEEPFGVEADKYLREIFLPLVNHLIEGK